MDYFGLYVDLCIIGTRSLMQSLYHKGEYGLQFYFLAEECANFRYDLRTRKVLSKAEIDVAVELSKVISRRYVH